MNLSVRPRRMSRADLRQLDDHVQMLVQGKLVALVLVLWLALAGVARADTITPTRFDDPEGAGDCPADCSLRQAVDRADTTEVKLKPGTYALTQGNALQIGRDLTLTGGGREVTVIDGSDNRDATFHHDRIVKVLFGTLQVSGVTFSNGHDEKDETCRSGCSSITSTGGGAIRNQSRLVLTDVGFVGNAASVGGGVSNSGTLQMTDVDFDANTAAFGGGLFVRGGTVDATRATFRNSSEIS